MYILPSRVFYTDDGQQCSRSAPFLILLSPLKYEGKKVPIRGIVRRVCLRQLGHFMMGHTTIKGHRLSLSGAYGNDGLPVTVSDDLFQLGTPLPDDLYEAWNKGGGWNSCGSEREAMSKWGLGLMKGSK
jgi:hypothetical protein